MRLTYDPNADRLVGGDFLRELAGRWTLSLILSLRRGKLLYETIGELRRAYDALPSAIGRGATPFSQALALLELTEFPVEVDGGMRMLSVDALFSLPELAAAPFEYRQLAQLVTVVPSTVSLASAAGELDEDALTRFVRQLFVTLGCGHHRAAMSFGGAFGSCVNPAALTPNGEFIDVYWFTRSSESPRGLGAFQRDDLVRALDIVFALANLAGADALELLTSAGDAYGAFVPHGAELRTVCKQAASEAGDEAPVGALRELAAAFHAGARR